MDWLDSETWEWPEKEPRFRFMFREIPAWAEYRLAQFKREGFDAMQEMGLLDKEGKFADAGAFTDNGVIRRWLVVEMGALVLTSLVSAERKKGDTWEAVDLPDSVIDFTNNLKRGMLEQMYEVATRLNSQFAPPPADEAEEAEREKKDETAST